MTPFLRYSMAKKFADLTAQVKTEKRFSRRLDYPTAAAATRSPPLDAAAAAAERLSPVVATSRRRETVALPRRGRRRWRPE